MVRLQLIGRRGVSKNSSKNSENVLVVSGYFLVVCKSTFFARFSLSDSRCMSDAITSAKLKQTGEIFLGQPRLFECMGICVLSPAHESEMRR